MRKYINKFALWLLMGTTIEYWVMQKTDNDTSGSIPFVYINGKRVTKKDKWTHIAIKY